MFALAVWPAAGRSWQDFADRATRSTADAAGCRRTLRRWLGSRSSSGVGEGACALVPVAHEELAEAIPGCRGCNPYHLVSTMVYINVSSYFPSGPPSILEERGEVYLSPTPLQGPGPQPPRSLLEGVRIWISGCESPLYFALFSRKGPPNRPKTHLLTDPSWTRGAGEVLARCWRGAGEVPACMPACMPHASLGAKNSKICANRD